MDASRSVNSSKLRLQATDALRRARRLPIGPHRNDLRQLAIGLRALALREEQEVGNAVMPAGILQAHSEPPVMSGAAAQLA